MDFGALAKCAEPLVSGLVTAGKEVAAKKGPELLLATGIALTGSAVVYSIKASAKGQDLLIKAEDTRIEQLKAGIKAWWPAGVLWGAGVFCIVASNRVQAGKMAAATAAATMFERTLNEYQEANRELNGDDMPVLESMSMPDGVPIQDDWTIDDTGEVWCKDSKTGYIFKLDRETLFRGEAEVNRRLASGEVVKQFELYQAWGVSLQDGTMFEATGWNPNEPKQRLHIRLGSTITRKGNPALLITYDVFLVEPWAARESL